MGHLTCLFFAFKRKPEKWKVDMSNISILLRQCLEKANQLGYILYFKKYLN